jgi:arginyl-tRNA synthetase
LGSALKKDREYGHSLQAKGERVLLEFVSANPTGPLNVVSARAAALGDSIGNLLAAAGAEVSREYYVNDAGVQARLFGESLLAAVSRVKGVPADAPEGGYQGAYMEDLAREYIGLFEGPGRTPPQDPGAWGMERVLGWHQASLKGYEVEFDRWFSERKELHESGAVDSTIERLKKEGLTYEKEGALWFKVSEFGAPKDEVLVKGDGKPAYFTPDIAYHLDKYARGYDRILDILGPDHHGHIQRLKAAMTALRLPVEKLTVLVAQQVNLLEGGEKVKMSKREGKFVKMDDLLSEVGKDAARYFFVMRSANTHLDFDLEVARKRTDENPVFYVQYAHARIHSLLRKCAERGLHPVKEDREFGSLREPEALLLLKGILEYPEWVAESGKAYEPHRIVAFLQGLAADFHLFYTKHRILDADPPVARARLGLVLGVATVLRNALGLLGVSAPEQM